MCRIFGVFDATCTPQELRTVSALQRHGGPDAQTFAAGPSWALGNNRLAVVDLDGGEQPYRLGDITVVFNGEIYNHEELRTRLRSRGYTFSDRCDGSILPALYAAYGDSFAEHLDGMYSLAVVDLRDEPRLVLATDNVGMKPLYYHWLPTTGTLRFASELPALFGFAGVPAQEWMPGLDAYLSSKTPFGEQTMFAGVRVLPPATTATVSRREGLRLRCRTSEPPPHADEPRPLAEVGRELRAILREEVRRLLVADVPVAAVTSGGLDSSLITALAAAGGTTDLHTFNIAYAGSWPSDERAFAQEVADRVGSTHHQVEIDPSTFPDLLSQVVWHLGQPNADPITLSTYALFQAVRDAGFTVALTGDAADELFGGYSRLTAATRAGEDSWVGPYLDSLSAVPSAIRSRLYTDEYRAALAEGEPALPGQAIESLIRGPGTRLQRLTAFEVNQRMPAYHLRRVDHLSMASSIEVRLPFCQPKVVRFAQELADSLKISQGQVKRALYAAAEDLLPASILRRPKQPFTLPITAMLAPGSSLWAMTREVLSPAALRADGRLRPSEVTAAFDRQAQRPSDTDALTLWSLTIHQLWRQQFFAASTVSNQLESTP